MRRLLLSLTITVYCFAVKAQLLTWSPLPTENDPAQALVITLDATKGNRGLLNYAPANDVYVHIGVITNLSTGAADWKYVIFSWGTTSSEARATYT